MAIAQVAIAPRTGTWSWSFELVKDERGSEMVAFGAARQPFNISYKLDGWFLRAYNGEVWACGKASGTAEQVRMRARHVVVIVWLRQESSVHGACGGALQVHPGDVVECMFDSNAGILTYLKNGKAIGRPVTGITETVLPACGFYGCDRTVKLVRFEGAITCRACACTRLYEHAHVAAGCREKPGCQDCHR